MLVQVFETLLNDVRYIETFIVDVCGLYVEFKFFFPL